MNDRPQAPAGSFYGETPRRTAVRIYGAAGGALSGALGLGATSAAQDTRNRNPVGSERKRSRQETHWARVASDSTLIAGKGFASAQRIKLAEYRLDSNVQDSFADRALSGAAERFRIVHSVSTSGVITLHLREFVNSEPPESPVYLDIDGGFSPVVICIAACAGSRRAPLGSPLPAAAGDPVP